jgi:hypothetical protein
MEKIKIKRTLRTQMDGPELPVGSQIEIDDRFITGGAAGSYRVIKLGTKYFVVSQADLDFAKTKP